jgi:hypothetical protein
MTAARETQVELAAIPHAGWSTDRRIVLAVCDTWPAVPCVMLPAMRVSGGTVTALPEPENLPAKDRRTIDLVSVVLLWLIVFVLPMLALDPDLSPRVQTVITDDEAALIAFAAGYTFYILGKLKDR